MTTTAAVTPTALTPKQRLDALLGRVTMYRLVVISLSILLVLAFALSAAGTLPYGVSDLAASLLVLLGVTYASNRLYAWMFGVSPHSESTIITALLLFFLLWPSSEPLELLALALAAGFASASKYLIAYRGRHIVNPAAIGVVFVTLLQLTGGVWWVATAPMLPVVAVLALLVAYRTRRLPMVGLFVAVAGALIVAFRVGAGDTVWEAVEYAFVSTPLVFLAGFMLTEPLTLPPLLRQQLAVAAGVAVLFALPNGLSIHLGTVSLTPEIALVIGNVVSFLLGQRRGIELTLREKRALGPTTAEFVFDVDGPVNVRPGQYMEVTVPHRRADSRGIRRVFSVSTADRAAGTVSFGIKIPAEKSSSFKRTFADLPPGSRIQATTVGGDFVLPTDPSEPLLLVAAGIGITPFVSHLAEITDAAAPRDAVLVYAVADADEIAYADVLSASGIRVVLVAPRQPSSLPAGWELVTGRLDRTVLADRIGDIAQRHAYVSGPPAMVTAISAALRGLKAKKVRTDAFTGY